MDLCDTDQEMVNDGSADDSNDKDYIDISDVSGFKRGGLLCSRKRLKRTKDREHHDIEGRSTYPLDILYKATIVTLSSSI